MTTRLLVLGAGNRGSTYTGHLRPADDARVVGVVDPRHEWRDRLADRHGLARTDRFATWTEAASSRVLDRVDAVINATPDRVHAETALAVMDAGLPMLLEKPLASTRSEVLRLAERAAQPDAPAVAVAHVLRHTPFYRALRAVIQRGDIGRVVQIRHQENLWFNHFAHSYVRGNWRREDQSSPFILAKCCHDLDLFGWLLDDEIVAASSFARLDHFVHERRPSDATDRCTDGCPVNCRYDARPLYLHERDVWPANTISAHPTIEARQAVLDAGPYGRCVYDCDNDVPDHQVASFLMAGGATVSLTISGHHHEEVRLTHIDGESGSVTARFGVHPSIDVHRHGERGAERIDVDSLGNPSGHGGGDAGLMRDFLRLVRDPGYQGRSALLDAVPSHLAAFAAEESRRTGRVVDVQRT